MLKRLLLAALLLPGIANAQFTNGQVLTAAQLNNAFAATLPLAGGTLTGPLTVPSLSVTGTPIPLASGGTGAATATGATSQLQYLQGDTGSTPRSLTNKFQDTVDAKDFGVKCDGTTNDTGAINTLLTSEVGKRIRFPTGTCIYNGNGTVGAGTLIDGSGRYATLFSANLPSQTLFNVTGTGAGIQHVGFTSNVTQTGGVYVYLGGIDNFIEDFSMSGDFNGVIMNGSGSRVRKGRFNNCVSGGTRILASGGDASDIIDDILMGAQSPQICRAGIEVSNSAALTIGHVSALQQGIGLLVDPTSIGTSVTSLYVHDSFFDTSSGPNIKLVATGTGHIVRLKFTDVWAGDGSTDSVQILNNGTGVVGEIEFVSPHILINTGAGVTTSGTISGLSFIGGAIAQNAYGMFINSGVSDLNIAHMRIGATGDMTGNTVAAISLASGVTNVVVMGNDLTGNGASLVDATGAITKAIKGNLGYNPIAATPITVGASPFTYTNNTGDTVSVFVNGGTVSNIALGGNTVAASTNTVISVPQGAGLVVTYTAAPTMTYAGY